ncbi:MAG: hypothetical protein ACJ76J_20205 [Thermoanaerobaculia bacterium]
MSKPDAEPARAPAEAPPFPIGRLLLAAGAAGLLALTFSFEPRLPDQPEAWSVVKVLAGGVLCPVLVLLFVHHAYLLGRWWHWNRRRKNEAQQVDRLQIPAAVRKPGTFGAVAAVDAVEKVALASIPDAQGSFRARALTTYAAPAMAVLLVGLQLSFWPKGPFGAGLVLGQAFLVLFATLRVLVDRRPSQEWIEKRTRGELFRREKYLLLARVGPYAAGRLDGPETRIAQIAGAGFERLTELVAMEYEDEPDRAPWLEYLASSSAAAALFDDLPERLTTYQYHRAAKQIAWMRSAAEDTEDTARRIEWFVGIAAAANILVAAVNFSLLLAETDAGAPPAGGVALLRTAVALGVFLPAFGGMLLALQSVFRLRILKESYRLTERSLDRLRKELIELQEEVEQAWPSDDAARRHRLGVRFQKLVLRVEAELTEEYLRWRIVTHRDAHELV